MERESLPRLALRPFFVQRVSYQPGPLEVLVNEVEEALEAEARVLGLLFAQNFERIVHACDTGQLAHINSDPADLRDQLDQMRAVLSAVDVTVEN